MPKFNGIPLDIVPEDDDGLKREVLALLNKRKKDSSLAASIDTLKSDLTKELAAIKQKAESDTTKADLAKTIDASQAAMLSAFDKQFKLLGRLMLESVKGLQTDVIALNTRLEALAKRPVVVNAPPAPPAPPAPEAEPSEGPEEYNIVITGRDKDGRISSIKVMEE